MATDESLKHNLYSKSLFESNIEYSTPDDFDQAKIGKMINNIVLNRHDNSDRRELMDVINKFDKKHVEHVILACTDLQILIPNHPTLKIYDTMQILASASVREILK